MFMLCIVMGKRTRKASASRPPNDRSSRISGARGRRRVGKAQAFLPHMDLVPNCRGTFHGGRRIGAGRPKTGRSVGVVHRRRTDVKKGLPIHVTVRFTRAVGYLRTQKVYQIVRRSLVAACQRRGFRICHFSLQRNHLHLIVEADGPAHLHKGMTGLLVRLSRALNRLRGRSGRVFPDRYHHAVKRNPTDVRNALRYVLDNARHHAHEVHDRHRLVPSFVDPFSSARYFDGWSIASRRRIPVPDGEDDAPVAAARSWLLTTGWRTRGLLHSGA